MSVMSASPQSMIDSAYPESAGPLVETAAGNWVPGGPGQRSVCPPRLDGETRDAQNREALAEMERKERLDAAMKRAAEIVAAEKQAPPRTRTAARKR